MYYYYYYFSESTKENKIAINFKQENDGKFNFAEFNEFLYAINELHRCVIYLTQPEYKNPDNLFDIDKIALVEYHSLQLETINRENPFLLKLTFNLLTSGYSLYWTLWKALINICEKYGQNDKELLKTIEKLFDFYKNHNDAIKTAFIDEQISTVLGEPIEIKQKDAFVSKMYSLIKSLILDKEKMKYYNLFCKSSISFTKIVSTFDKIEDIILLENKP